jgi:prepilin-type N-terminal cleavage/methylation domain-containing protein
MNFLNQMKRSAGFTLTELLVSLLIIGEIATFTIPKVLYAQQNTAYRAGARDAAAAVSQAFFIARSKGGDYNLKGADFTPYLNYVRYDTSTRIDGYYTNATAFKDCSSAQPCIQLASGGMVMFDGNSFGGTNSTNAIWFRFDPDGKYTDGTTNGPGKPVEFFLYYSGRITTSIDCEPNSSNASTTLTCTPTPPWFSW